ncbi:MAG: DUF1761 domain-containing protein [Novosphingobium sp.]|nr:DUF1761 domain-containing protein [Novosphingobium sp.]
MWEMNWIAVVLAAAAGFVVGGIWYGPLFGKAWQRESGLSDESIKGANMPMIFGLVALLNLFAAFILGHVLATYGRPDFVTSTIVGGGIGLGFIATSLGVNYLFARKSLKLFAIDACYWTLVYAVMGAIFGVLS